MNLLDLPVEIQTHIIQQLPLGSRYPLRAVNHQLKLIVDYLPLVYQEFFRTIDKVSNLVLVPHRKSLFPIRDPRFQLVTHTHRTGLINLQTQQHVGFKILFDTSEQLTRADILDWSFQYGSIRMETLNQLVSHLGWHTIALELKSNKNFLKFDILYKWTISTS